MASMKAAHRVVSSTPDWYKDAVIYELHVRTFYDSDGDGIGDFQGLVQKLDYLKDLGVTAVWLLPFYPSPLKDDGYDIADYVNVNPSYGSLSDFQNFLRAAHRLGLKVITELVVNHTSDQHPWFQRARRSKPGSAWRNFYVWSDTAQRYREARVIFQDFERSNWTWDPVAQAYYWHRFYAHQPDLNYDNPQVQKAVLRAMDFWLGMGVDGLRLDAVPYLYEREGTTCENLPETHAFLKHLRRHVDEKYPHRMLLAEANQWPEDAAAYFGDGDECHMAFHFPLMPRLFMAIHKEDRFPILDILEQTPTIHASCQWALFLRNHDELTLEMVTEQERDYMYQVYANDPQARINLGIRRRLAPLLGNNRRRIELLHGLLFALPGTPVLYYGNEIGMGDNIYLGDRDGVRTPFQWSGDRNAGFSHANPQRLCLPVVVDPEYHYEAINVEAQEQNPHSLLWWMKRLIALRQRTRAFGRGTLEHLHPDNPKVLVFLRRYEDEVILVVANLSRFVQSAELDLKAYAGRVPVEMFGHTEFPPIGALPYFITLGPHSFYYFSLSPVSAEDPLPIGPTERPLLVVEGDWESAVIGEARSSLEALLPDYIRASRWFGGKTRRIASVRLRQVVPIAGGLRRIYLTVAQLSYRDGGQETYLLPLAYADEAETSEPLFPALVIVRVVDDAGRQGFIFDAAGDPGLARVLLEGMLKHRRWKGIGGFVTAIALPASEAVLTGAESEEPRLLSREQTNTSVAFGEQALLKFYRRLEPGINPDREVGTYLTRGGFQHVPDVLGYLELCDLTGRSETLAVMHAYIKNQGDAWRFTLESLARYQSAIASRLPDAPHLIAGSPLDGGPWVEAPQSRELFGDYLDAVRLLARRTAELHASLARQTSDPDFEPEPFTPFYLRGLYQSMRTLTGQSLQTLRKRLGQLSVDIEAGACWLLDHQADILDRFRLVLTKPLSGLRIRSHGDFHLGQVLCAGGDFVIVDFEGEPSYTLAERRAKRSPLRDVAGMLRSFHYAARTALRDGEPFQSAAHRAAMEAWLNLWYGSVVATFLDAYRAYGHGGQYLPDDKSFRPLLELYMLEKALYELQYELDHRPEWVDIPLRGLLDLLKEPGALRRA